MKNDLQSFASTNCAKNPKMDFIGFEPIPS
jgi:hypothetical protein